MIDLAQRLRDGADRFLKWAHKQQYSGPPVISIPVHDGNIDQLMEEAAKLIEWQAAEIVNMRSAISTAREEGRLAGLEEAAKVADAHDLSIMSSTMEDAQARKIAAAIRSLKEKQP